MKIGILGEGVTAKAVREKIRQIGYQEVSVDLAELVVASPGIAPNDFPSCSARIISEIEFAYLLLRQEKFMPKIIGVTGTNGKTTVTSLIAHLLEAPCAGNIGIPLINFVALDNKPETIVVELSSYQLEMCFDFKPDIAVILNFSPDHISRHGNMEAYIKQKAKIFEKQTNSEALVFYAADKEIQRITQNAKARKYPYSIHSKEKDLLDDFQLKGDHNRLNGIAASICAKLNGLTEERIKKRIALFLPIEHRLEQVVHYKGRLFINDSKATNPESTRVAVDAFNEPINLILGGKDKGLDIDDFMMYLLKKVNSLTVFGEISARVEQLANKMNKDCPIIITNDIEDAIEQAYKFSSTGELILFSPACSSFDQFDNFEHRGKVFKEVVKKKYTTLES